MCAVAIVHDAFVAHFQAFVVAFVWGETRKGDLMVAIKGEFLRNNFIYDDKVAVISLNPDELIGMIFESPVYARSQRAIFNLAWLGATSFIAT